MYNRIVRIGYEFTIGKKSYGKKYYREGLAISSLNLWEEVCVVWLVSLT